MVRPTLRWKLTALYGALFFVGGSILLAVNYSLVASSLPKRDIAFSVHSEGSIPGLDTVTAPPPGEAGSGEAVGIVVDGQPVTQSFIQKLPTRLRSSALHDLVWKSLVGLAAVAAASLALGWWLAGRALRPIHQITDTARRLSETNLDERIALDGPNDELRELAETFDAMLERLDTAFDSQRRFVANASHELRTPLAIMRAQLEVARTPEELEAATAVVQQVIGRSERLLDGLLVLARADGELTMEDTDLADALEAAAPTDARVTIAAAPAPVHGDPALLAHLARNLLDNATRYNVEAGWVRAATRRDGDRAVLEVSNSGPLISPHAVEGFFEPFRRGGADRTGGADGAGLGLSIVRAVARAHGGDATAAPLPDGGLRVEVRLPAALTTVTPRPAGVVQRQNISFPS